MSCEFETSLSHIVRPWFQTKGKRKKSETMSDHESVMHKLGLEYRHCYYSVLTQPMVQKTVQKKAES